MYQQSVLFTECNGAFLCIHTIHDGQRLHMVAKIPDYTAANLEALFDNDTAAFHDGTSRFRDGNQTLEGAAIGQKIINDQNVFTFVQELLGNDDIILILVCKGFHFCHIHFAIQVDGLGLLGKDHGNAKFLGNKSSNTDTGSFNGHNLGNGLMAETALELPADFLHQLNIHLMVQKTVNLQNIARLYDSVFYNSLF